MLRRLGIDGKALLVDVKPEDKLSLSVRNIEGVRLLPSNRISARDVVNTRRVVLTRAALEKLQEALGYPIKVMKLTDVIRRPLITEKTTVIREDGRTLVFEVASDANKIDIRRAVEQLLGSKVESVRTSLAHGKMKRQGTFRRPALGLEEGVRDAARGREAARVPAGGVTASWPIRKFNPTSPGARFRRRADVRRDHDATSRIAPLTEKLHRSGGRNNRGRSRRGGAAAATSGSIGSSTSSATRRTFPEGSDGRVRPEPLVADRARHLCRMARSATSCSRRA